METNFNLKRMNKLEILEKVGFDLEKAKAIHQWLNEGTAAQPVAQTAAAPDGVSITEQDGEKGVRLCVGDIDIFIEAHDLDEDGKEFEWDEAMKKLEAYGKRTFDKHEMYLMAAYRDEINAALREIGGAELDNYYWSSTENGSNGAWFVYFSSGFITYTRLNYTSFTVRPCAAFKHE